MTEEISYAAFLDTVKTESSGLVSLCIYFKNEVKQGETASRSFLGLFYHETSKLEEFLDKFGAQKNSRWFYYRRLMASGKLFSRVAYNLLHMKYFSPAYRLLPVDGGFLERLDEELKYLTGVISSIAESILFVLSKNGISISGQTLDLNTDEKFSLAGKLP